jgi:hypothetical protein
MESNDDPASRPNSNAADGLREQAAACRRLANQARTRAGKKGLDPLGDHFDEQARKLDPFSLKR